MTFQIRECLPFPLTSLDEEVNHLKSILTELKQLEETGKLQKCDFGSNYAPDAVPLIREIQAKIKLKVRIPVDIKLELTKILVNACFNSLEPALVCRYGSLVNSLWRGRTAKAELRHLRNVIDWSQMYKVMKNVILLNGKHSSSSDLRRSKSHETNPSTVLLQLANTFNKTIHLTNSEFDDIFNDLLSFVDSAGRAEVPLVVVLEILPSIIPYNDDKSLRLIDIVFKFMKFVPQQASTAFLVTILGNFALARTLASKPSPFNNNQLRECFQLILNSLMIPLSSDQKQGNSSKSSFAKLVALNSKSFAKLVVWSISSANDSLCVLQLLKNFVSSVLSFCHPSNSGIWSITIFSTLVEILEMYVFRLNMEKELTLQPQFQLNDAETVAFTSIFVEPMFLGLHNQMPAVLKFSSSICQYLGSVSPDLIVPRILSEFYQSLQMGTTHSQRLIASVSALSMISVPLTQQLKYKLHLTTVLELLIPGIDINEPGRCMLTLSVFQHVASLCKFEDLSDSEGIELASNVIPQLVSQITSQGEADVDSHVDIMKVVEGTSFAYNDVLSQFLLRSFDVLDQNPDNSIVSEVTATIARVLSACSEPLFKKLLDLLIEELTNPMHQGHTSLSRVCGVFVRLDCSLSFEKLWQVLYDGILFEIAENNAGKSRVVLPKDEKLARFIGCLNMCILSANSHFLVEKHKLINDLLLLLWRETGQSVLYTVANLAHHAISGLVNYSVVIPYSTGEHREFTSELSITESISKSFQWHSPTQESVGCAVDLFETQFNIAKEFIRDALQQQSSLVAKDNLIKAITMLRTSLGASSAVNCVDKIQQLRSDIADLIKQTYLEMNKDDNTSIRALLFLCKVWICDVGYERTAKLDVDQQALYQFEKHLFRLPGSRKDSSPPILLTRRAQLFYHQHLVVKTQHRLVDGIAKNLLSSVVLDCALSSYPGVQNNAYSTVNASLKLFQSRELYADVYRYFLVSVERNLPAAGSATGAETSADDGNVSAIEGALGLLRYGSIFKYTIGSFPEFFSEFYSSVVKILNLEVKDLSNEVASIVHTLLPQHLKLSLQSDTQLDIDMPLLSKVHWSVAAFVSTVLINTFQMNLKTLNQTVLSQFFEGVKSYDLVVNVKNNCLTGVIQLLHAVLRCGMLGYDFNDFKANGNLELPVGAFESRDENLLQNDISQFFSLRSVCKQSMRPTGHVTLPNCQGWLAQPTYGIWRAPAPDHQDQQQSEAQLSKLDATTHTTLLSVLRTYNSTKYWTDLYNLWCIEPQKQEQNRINQQTVLLVRDLTVFAHFKYCESSLTDLLNVDFLRNPQLDDRNSHRSLAIFVAGLLCSAPLLTTSEFNEILDLVCNIFTKVYVYLAPENTKFWVMALTFSFQHIDYRRLIKLHTFLQMNASPSTSEVSGIKLGLRSALFTEVQAAIGWRHPSTANAISNWQNWDHSLEIMRTFASDELSVALMSSLKPESKNWNDSFSMQLNQQVVLEISNLFKTTDGKVKLSLLHFLLRIIQLIDGDILLSLLKSGGMEFILQCSTQRDDPEVVVLCTKVCYQLGTVTYSVKSIPLVVEMFVNLLQVSNWHGKIRMLLLIQQFTFNHLLILTNDWFSNILEMIIKLLYNHQVEVRELASDTLSGIVRCNFEVESEGISNLCQRFVKDFDQAKTETVRHGAILGLGAIISAFPYTSPPPKWIPPLLSLLAVKGVNDVGMIAKSAKYFLSEFKKTRQDSWHIDQKSFSQDQLDDLDGVLWKNYFA